MNNYSMISGFQDSPFSAEFLVTAASIINLSSQKSQVPVPAEQNEGWVYSLRQLQICRKTGVETTRGAISAEILTDFLTMAKNHLEAGNLQSAAILAGAVTEEHLRRLCLANEISIVNRQSSAATAKKPLQLTGEAYKKKLYDRQLHKNIISWLELSAKAGHNAGSELSEKQTAEMITGVGTFLREITY